MIRGMKRFVALLLGSLLAPLAGATAQQGSAATPAALSTANSIGSAQVQTDLQLERKLLALDLVSYREARSKEQAARTQVDEAMQRLDQALSGASLALGTLESLFDSLSTARAAAQITGERVDWQVQRLQDRMRRISFLEGEVGGAGRPARNESVAGRWQVRIQPQNATGVFDLRLEGTVISGTYEVGTSRGSLRGTIVDRNLRLERIDAKGGFDSVFLGAFDPAAQTITGSWTSNELANGQPTRGEWSATRANAGEERQP
jgi:hypothetical protein